MKILEKQLMYKKEKNTAPLICKVLEGQFHDHMCQLKGVIILNTMYFCITQIARQYKGLVQHRGMAVKSRAVAPEAETLAAYCLGQDRVEKLTHPKDINYPFKRGCSSSTESRFFSCRSLSILMYSSSWKTEQCRGCERGACLLSKV